MKGKKGNTIMKNYSWIFIAVGCAPAAPEPSSAEPNLCCVAAPDAGVGAPPACGPCVATVSQDLSGCPTNTPCVVVSGPPVFQALPAMFSYSIVGGSAALDTGLSTSAFECHVGSLTTTPPSEAGYKIETSGGTYVLEASPGTNLTVNCVPATNYAGAKSLRIQQVQASSTWPIGGQTTADGSPFVSWLDGCQDSPAGSAGLCDVTSGGGSQAVVDLPIAVGSFFLATANERELLDSKNNPLVAQGSAFVTVTAGSTPEPANDFGLSSATAFCALTSSGSSGGTAKVQTVCQGDPAGCTPQWQVVNGTMLCEKYAGK